MTGEIEQLLIICHLMPPTISLNVYAVNPRTSNKRGYLLAAGGQLDGQTDPEHNPRRIRGVHRADHRPPAAHHHRLRPDHGAGCRERARVRYAGSAAEGAILIEA